MVPTTQKRSRFCEIEFHFIITFDGSKDHGLFLCMLKYFYLKYLRLTHEQYRKITSLQQPGFFLSHLTAGVKNAALLP